MCNALVVINRFKNWTMAMKTTSSDKTTFLALGLKSENAPDLTSGKTAIQGFIMRHGPIWHNSSLDTRPNLSHTGDSVVTGGIRGLGGLR